MTVKNETPVAIYVGDTLIEPNTSKEVPVSSISNIYIHSKMGSLKIHTEFGLRRFTRYCKINAREEQKVDRDGISKITIYCE